MNYEEKIAKLAAARDAVEAAKVACDAAGVVASVRGSEHDVFDVLAKRIDATRASVERQRPRIAIGDEVLVGMGRHGQWGRARLTAAGDRWITAGGSQYDRKGGGEKTMGCSYPLHPDDLARVNRELPPRRAKGAEVNRG